jgi:uncharacterized membrane protein
VIGGAIAGYYLILRPAPEPYNSIYLLDTNNQAIQYTQNITAGQNFNLIVGAENHMGDTTNQTYRVQVKITQNLHTSPVNVEPINSYDFSLADGDKWQTTATVRINTSGYYSVVFELWKMGASGSYEFTQDYCVLNVQVS